MDDDFAAAWNPDTAERNSPCRLIDSFCWSYIPGTDDAVLVRGNENGFCSKRAASP